jgi:hypothetical protein
MKAKDKSSITTSKMEFMRRLKNYKKNEDILKELKQFNSPCGHRQTFLINDKIQI